MYMFFLITPFTPNQQNFITKLYLKINSRSINKFVYSSLDCLLWVLSPRKWLWNQNQRALFEHKYCVFLCKRALIHCVFRGLNPLFIEITRICLDSKFSLVFKYIKRLAFCSLKNIQKEPFIKNLCFF